MGLFDNKTKSDINSGSPSALEAPFSDNLNLHRRAFLAAGIGAMLTGVVGQEGSSPKEGPSTKAPPKSDVARNAEPERNYDPRIKHAMSVLRMDPGLTKLIDKKLSEEKPSVSFVLDKDVSKTAREFGYPAFVGDAFTLHAQVMKPDGKLSTAAHVVVMNEKLLGNGAELLVALQHELYHIKIAEEGKVSLKDRRGGEIAAFQSSTEGLKNLMSALTENRERLLDETEIRKYDNLIDGLKKLLPRELDYLSNWRKR